MAKLAPYGPFRAFDNNGDPLVGGKLYTYEAGTLTPKATFTTADGDIQNANPVILDLNGYANVWLDDGSYKFILTTSADATLWTIDDVQGDTSASFGSQVVTQATNLAITNVFGQAIINATATQTHSLPPAASVGSGFYYVVNNTSSSGTVTVDPDGSETINGAANYAFTAGTSGLVYTDGSNWFTSFDKALTAANLSAKAANTVITNNTASSAVPTALAMGESTVLARLAAGNIVAATPAEIRTLLGGNLLNIQTFTGSGTYTPTTGMANCLVLAWGGGGAGGGATTTGAGQISAGGGGTAGALAWEFITAATIGTSQVVTIGAGGVGDGDAGAAGGNTTLGSLLTATGGNGGGHVAAINSALFVAGGLAVVATNAGINGGGGAGGNGALIANTVVSGGIGASAMFGGGGWGTNGASAGGSATGYGAGGGGGANTQSQGSARNGGNGAGGLMIILEFA